MEPEVIDLLDSPPLSPVKPRAKQAFKYDVDIPASPKRKREDSVADSGYGGSISKRRPTTPMKTPTPAPRSTKSPILERPNLMRPFMQSLESSMHSMKRHDPTTSNTATTVTTKTSDKRSTATAPTKQPAGNDQKHTDKGSPKLPSTSPDCPSQHADSTYEDFFATASTNAEPIATSIDTVNATTTTADSANTTANNTTPTPMPTPTTSKLAHIPQIHPRHVPTYHSPHSPTKLYDPATFSLKPPFWRRWKPAEYTLLATHLSQAFDPLPLARQLGKSAQEIQQIFNAIVVAPLEDEAGKVARVVEGRMEKVFDLFAKGVQMRTWQSGDEQVKGEFTGVRPGVVELVDERGGFVEVAWADLAEGDRVYVEGLVGREEMGVLLREG